MKKIHLQDVVFAAGRDWVGDDNPKAAAFRASITPVSILGDEAVMLEKMDLQEVRNGLIKMFVAGAFPFLDDDLGEWFAPPSLTGLRPCPQGFGMQHRGQSQTTTSDPAVSVPRCQLKSITRSLFSGRSSTADELPKETADVATQTEPMDAMFAAEEAIIERHTHFRGGKLALNEKHGYWLRSMQVDGDCSDNKLNLNLGIVYMYLLGRVIPKALMWGKGTVSAVNNRLQWHEKKTRSDRVTDMVKRYPRTNIFVYSDDSKNWHAVGPSFPYIHPVTSKRSIERSITTMAHCVKKKDAIHAATDKEVMEDEGFPIERIRGGGTDHPAKSEICELVRLCTAHLDAAILMIWLGCGCHKTNLLMVHIAKILCPDTERGVFTHKQFAFVLRYIATYMVAFSAFAEHFMGCKGWWCCIPKMQQEQRWHMTAEAMRWILRLMRLKKDGALFLPAFARHMYTITEGVTRALWKDFATWIRKPELVVYMMLEVECDDIVAKPFNIPYYKQKEGYPPGFCIRELVMYIHGTWRPLIERLATNPFSILRKTAALKDALPPELRNLVDKQVMQFDTHTHTHYMRA